MNCYPNNKKRNVSLLSFTFIILLCCLFALPNTMQAQTNTGKTKTVTGVVTDEKGEPVIGATVTAKGAKRGVITDIQGRYTLQDVPSTSTVVVSYIGYQPTRLKADGSADLSKVVLKEDTKVLDDVVVLGYGNIRRRDVTGSVASVNADQISKVASSNVVDAIQGKMAGVSITTTDGDLDAEIRVRVRGGGSITQDNSPLYLVDGFPVDNLKGIPPTDIESIDVLKEASMTAIYGARGANGVVVITTKNAKAGTTQVQYNGYIQARTLARKLPVMSAYEYVMSDYEYEMIRGGSDATFIKNFGYFDDLDLYKYLPSNDWQDKLLGGHPTSQSHNVVISGGSQMTKFNLSYTHNHDNGQLIGSGLTNENINLKLNHQLFKTLRIETNSTYNVRTVNGAGTSGVSVLNALRYRPTNGLSLGYTETEEDEENLDAQGNTLNVKYAPTDENVQNYHKSGANTLSLRAALIWDIAQGWQFRSEYGVSTSYGYSNSFYGALSGVAASAGMNNMPSASKSKTHSESYRLANTLSFQKIFNKKHSLNLLIGQEINNAQSDNTFTSVRYYPVSITAQAALENFSLGTPNQSTSYKSAPVRTASFFGRALYDYKQLYYATFTLRADGSTKFAPKHQWGYFPAASIAWRLSNEEWMKSLSFISDIKIRASLGQSGNNRISDDLWHSVYRVYSGASAPAFNNQEYNYYQFADQTNLYDPNLKWETTITRNLGVDFSLFDNRLSGTIDIYKNTTKDLLVPSVIPNTSGYTRQMTNIGQTTNRGIEISLMGEIVRTKDFYLSANFNIAFNKNRVDKLANGETEWKLKAGLSDWWGTYNYKLEVGKTMGLIYGLVNDGFYTTDDFNYDETTHKWTLKDGIPNDATFSSGNFAFKPGAMKFKKMSTSDNMNITEDDVVKIGDTNPKATGGFGLSANWKGFDLTAFFTYMLDFDVFNVNKLYLRSALRRNYSNLTSDMDLAHRYRYIDDNGVNVSGDPVALADLNKNAKTYTWMSVTQGITMTDLIEDGSFLRLSTLTLGYTLPRNLLHCVGVKRLRVYLSSNNLFLLTKYSGYDPEVNVQNGMTPGIDSNRYPRSRTFTLGVNLVF
jgi:TonB-linked SusC/RagA family outer membrane protein